MNLKDKIEKLKKQRFQHAQLAVLQNKSVSCSTKSNTSILLQSAKDFQSLLDDLNVSGLNMKKIHAFNAEIAGIADKKNLTPEDMLVALELLAKYIVLHSNLSGGQRINRIVSLLGFDVKKLCKEGRLKG
jgi:hypothetical protein